MRKNKRQGIMWLVMGDWLGAFLAWFLFFTFRKLSIEKLLFDWSFYIDPKLFIGLLLIPLAWLLFYYITGTYTDIYRKSRLSETFILLVQSVIGVLVLFFVLMLDDVILSYRSYYQSLFGFFALHYGMTFLMRFSILTKAKKQLESGSIAYKTLLVGGNQKARDLYKEISNQRVALGYDFLGFINTNGQAQILSKDLPELGKIPQLATVCEEKKIDEVILAIEKADHKRSSEILNALIDQEVVIKMIPDMYDILSGSVRTNNVMGAALIEIYPDTMPPWQRKLKRIIDMVVSSIVLILLTPLYLYLAIRVRNSSKGPIFYYQERVGHKGKPFNIIKFRSMYTNAEEQGPALSSDDDPRVTPWGRVMRKWRLDEIPQFYNVFKGEMSLVGPRPERQYFIDQLALIAPEYRHLQKVKPGITSWGMVKFGYAENLDQMIERMKFDLIYLDNRTLVIDFKILIHTVLILFQGKGK